MVLTGNKGEWSEIYVFLRLLADGKIFAADEQRNRIKDMFFPVIKIIREEISGQQYEYCLNASASEIDIYLNKKKISQIPIHTFDAEAKHLLNEIKNKGNSKGSFSSDRTEKFIRSIQINKLKAPSSNKSDINIKIHDINTGFEKSVGFSIKSELGMPSTLLNPGHPTNFIYNVSGLNPKYIDEINSIDSKSKIKDRIKMILTKGGKLNFLNMENETFYNNLVMIDSQMPVVIANMLLGHYSDKASDCVGLTDDIIVIDPLSFFPDFYSHKVKDLLCAVALGMTPATKWNGRDEATGGYIIVKTDGDVLAYHIYNRDAFRNYLLNNTKFESPSSSRYNYGKLYVQSDGSIQIKLNLQIRFK